MKKTCMTFAAPKSRRPSSKAAFMKRGAALILLSELAEKAEALGRRLAEVSAEKAALEAELASAKACAELLEANF